MLRRGIFVITVLVLWMALAPQARAVATSDVLVEVEADGESALLARSNALTQGPGKALLKLLETLRPERAADVVAKAGADGAAQLVSHFEVKQEKSAAHHYAAQILYHLDKDKIDRLLAEDQGLLPGVATQALLVLPLYQDEKQLMLWEKGNPWRETFNRVALEEGKGMLVMAFGDPRDALIIDDATVLSGDRAAMVKLAERYGTRNVVIAQALSRVTKDGEPRLKVLLRRGGAKDKEEQTELLYKPVEGGETAEAMRERAARDVARRLTESASSYSLFADDEARQVQARVVRAEYRHNRQWMQIKQAMDGLPHVDYVDIGAVAPDFAQITLYFRGSDAVIHQALLARGVAVEEADGYWKVGIPQ